MGRCRQIDTRIWSDKKFQLLWSEKWSTPCRVPKRYPYPLKAFPDKRMGVALERRHRFRKIVLRITPDVFQRLGSACLYCGATDNIKIDHVIPICWGGTNDIENFQPLCHKCNSLKGGLLPEAPDA